MDREKLDLALERGITGLVLAMLVIGPLVTGAVRAQDFAILLGLSVLATGLWVLRFWVSPNYRMQWPPICWTVIAFALYAIVRYRQADVEYVARQELTRVLLYAWLFFLVLNNLHRQETTQILASVLLTLGTLIAMYAIYQFLTHSPYVWHFAKPSGYFGRGSGTYICPNHLAGLLEMLLPIALALLFVSRYRAVTKVLIGYAAVVILVGIGASVSRGGWVATGLSLLVFFGILFRQRNYRLLVLLTVLVIGVGVSFSALRAREISQRWRLMLTPSQVNDIRIRPNLWVPALKLWQDSPWLGVGPGHYDVRFPLYRPTTVQSRPLWVHNDYLNALVDYGVVGVGIIAAFLACLVAGVIKTLRYVHRSQNDLVAKKSDRAAFVLGMSVGLLALLFHSVVEFNLHVPANAILAITLLASLTSHLRFATDRYWFTPGWTGRLVVTGLGAASFVYLGQQTLVGYREARELAAADAARTQSGQMTALLSAHTLEPRNAETVSRIGEIHRLRSWEGGEGWQELVAAAMRWFELAMRLNPHDTYPVAHYGMCLDWLKRPAEAAVYFERALKMDPNSYYLALLRGWHELQTGNYLEARKWLYQSYLLKWQDNPAATNYLAIVNARLGPDAK